MASRVNRAKQFLPFDALIGFREALRKKEQELEYEEKIELDEEVIEKISKQIAYLNIGDYVKVKYYNHKKYVEIEGRFEKVNRVKRKLQIGPEEINFEDILELTL